MTSVVFSTPGLIPIEAFTIVGMSAKPNSTNPFGKFGTGLKIAVAVCLRLGQQVEVWIGRDKYTFYTKAMDFRGKEFQKIRMKRETWHIGDLVKKSYVDLPFTTEFGKHWELWQAFREFQTNTMDENGSTFLNNDPELQNLLTATGNTTAIIVTGAKFVDEYHDRHRNFLEDGLTVREGSDRIQVLNKRSKHVYFRGVRVWDLKEESVYTYNFLMDIELTEDRTAKYPFMLEAHICEHIMQSNDESFLKKTVEAPPEASFEKNLGYRYTSAIPSSTFTTSARAPTAAPQAKLLVKVVETKKDFTRITIEVPRKLEKGEVGAITGAILELHTDAKIWTDDDDMPF